ncbi:hypothetical protein RB600_001828 [Gaeumannomyces tritici]
MIFSQGSKDASTMYKDGQRCVLRRSINKMVQLKSLVILLPLLSVAAALPAGEPPARNVDVAATGPAAPTFDQDTLAQLLAADEEASPSFSESDLERRNWLTNLFKKKDKKKPINKQDIKPVIPPSPPAPPAPPAPFHGPSSNWKKQGLENIVPPGKKPQKRNWLTNLFKKKDKEPINKQDIKPIIPPSPPAPPAPPAPFHGPSSDWKKQGLENIVPPGKKPGQ